MQCEGVVFLEVYLRNVSIKPISAIDQTYEVLLNAIINGKIKAGNKIIVSKMANFLNISRTPVRGALMILEAEGWVNRENDGTLRVTKLSVTDLKDLFEVRAVLEGLLTREATAYISSDELKTIEEELFMFSTYANKGDIRSLTTSGEKIHTLIHEKSQNQLCKKMFIDVEKKLSRYRVLSSSVPGRAKEAEQEHLKIIKAIREKDSTKAENAMRDHVLSGGTKLLKEFKKELNH